MYHHDAGCFADSRVRSRAAAGHCDVQENTWYYNDVKVMVNAGIMKGKGSDTFDPNGKITNAEMAQILKNMNMKDASSEYPDFSDVEQTAWYFSAAKAYGKYFPTHFDRYTGEVYFWPSEPISRADLAYTLLLSSGVTEEEIVTTYMEISGEEYDNGWKYYPEYALRVMAEMGIISGYANGELGEYDDVSRAQCAAILNRMIQLTEHSAKANLSGVSDSANHSVGTLVNTDLYSVKVPESWGQY